MNTAVILPLLFFMVIFFMIGFWANTICEIVE